MIRKWWPEITLECLGHLVQKHPLLGHIPSPHPSPAGCHSEGSVRRKVWLDGGCRYTNCPRHSSMISGHHFLIIYVKRYGIFRDKITGMQKITLEHLGYRDRPQTFRRDLSIFRDKITRIQKITLECLGYRDSMIYTTTPGNLYLLW
jgi:hypothetical protein